MIQLEHISKKFKKKTILNDISYTFETGKIYGIYGINGSGKTMLHFALFGGRKCVLERSLCGA